VKWSRKSSGAKDSKVTIPLAPVVSFVIDSYRKTVRTVNTFSFSAPCLSLSVLPPPTTSANTYFHRETIFYLIFALVKAGGN